MSQISRSPAAAAIISRRKKPPHPSPSPRRNKNNKSKSVKILKRCSSAPLLISPRDNEDDLHLVAQYSFMNREQGDGTLFRPQTFSHAFVSSPSLFPTSPKIYSNEMKGYDKEAKVVVNVTVEGSTGPVRTMVKLGSTVDDTIRHVLHKYREEGRSPKIDDSNVPSSFQLYLSYFSLQGLDKSEVIGDVNSRSFYLRKSNGESTSNDLAKHSSANPPPMLLPSFIVRKINKIVRRAQRLWNILVCSP
ncbi:uncharacterized protein At4g22758 [Trifolium pratense]|uniref:uncharacterized protein At4g22758 n=1 Tax=Trifolium pratense TaxID=57577 RepID=UPI001E6975CC|nr:uncharacterized protein At4g22758 [Trifolium pratense]